METFKLMANLEHFSLALNQLTVLPKEIWKLPREKRPFDMLL